MHNKQKWCWHEYECNGCVNYYTENRPKFYWKCEKCGYFPEWYKSYYQPANGNDLVFNLYVLGLFFILVILSIMYVNGIFPFKY